MLKLGNEVESFTQTQMWGYNIIDILHSVRRAQAINSSIKEAGLKYITKFINAEAPDRVYVDHDKIGSMYRDKEDYWLNTENGKYKKVGVDSKVEDLLRVSRLEDEGNNLWAVYNRIQENLTYDVRNPDMDIKLNQQLFALAESYI